MKKCNLVTNSLEAYSANNTDKSTNKFIEKHILKCKDCKNKLLEIKNGKALLDNLNKKTKKKYKNILTTFISIFILLVILFIISFNTPSSIIYSMKKSEKPLNTLYNYLTNAYELYDYNYKTVLDIYILDDNITGNISFFDKNNYLIEEKSIYYFSPEAHDEQLEAYKNFSVPRDNISNLKMTDNIISLDWNYPKTKTLNDMFPDTTPIINKNRIFLVLE